MLKFFDHYRGLVSGFALSAAMAAILVGCQPTVESPTSGKPVTQGELAIEAEEAYKMLQLEQAALQVKVDTVKARYELKAKEIEEKQAMIDRTINALGSLVTTIPDPSGVLAALVSILLPSGAAAGLYYDTRRKDHVISTLKESTNEQAR